MSFTIDEQEQELSNILVFKDDDGRIAVTIGLLVTVFFENQLTKDVMEAVAEVAEDYVQSVNQHLRWQVSPDAKRESAIDLDCARLPKPWLLKHPDGKSWEFLFHGGETAKAASAFHVHGFGAPIDSDGGLGFLHMSFPLLWFAERSDTFPNYVLRVCKRIRPLSGYAGIGVLESSDGYAQGKFQPVVRQLAERFPGLEVEDRPGHTNHLLTGIKGVNWLTILGERWTKEIGGLDYLRIRLGEEFIFYPYDESVIIQAGPKPQIGDLEANNWPRLYVTLAKVLKRIQIKNHYPFHFGGPGRMNSEASKAWLFRFDDK